jgi:uncharacterized Zn finger protein
MSRYFGYPKYVSVAERRAKASQKANKKKAAGQEVFPVKISGRKISKSFWGQAWCDQVESFGDYSNRLPRGRTYVRNGSVWHLEISKGKVLANVYGSSSYDINIDIKTLAPKKWQALKKKCTGKISSLVELLSGELPDAVMRDVTHPKDGLLPSASEINYNCTCPDWANMCKHVAAVIYGIGARLDEKPELLFLLRGVDHNELISKASVDELIGGKGSAPSSRRRKTVDVENVFGLQLQDETSKDKTTAPKRRTSRAISSPKAKGSKVQVQKKNTAKKVFKPTARKIQRLRKAMGLSQKELAETLSVSLPSVSKWEKTTGPLPLRQSSLEKLKQWWEAESHRL